MKNKKNELKNIRFSRLYILVALFLFGVILFRIKELSLNEVVENTDIQALANSRTTKQETLYSKRGTIYDNKGEPLAENISSYTLIAYLSPKRTGESKTPKHVVDPEYTAQQLATVLDIPEEQILGYLTKDAYQVELGPKAKNLTELKKDEILALNLPGIDFIETQQRYYPFGRFASYVVGYARKKEVENEDGETVEDIVGEMGIEAFYNNTLTGTNGSTLYQKDRSGYKIPGTKEIVIDAVDGNDIYLTIDSSIQLFVEDSISALASTCNPNFISVMLADAKTGAILASGTYPSFDPNIKNIETYLNLNTSSPFEPGSTMKIFSYMAAMENGVYNGQEKYKSGIFKAKDGTEIGDWKRAGWGYITYDQGFALSSNVAVMNLIDKYMNADMLRAYYKKLGFGSKTGIELPNESSGKLEFKYQTEILNAGFGQGITTTPVQFIKALTSISNDGILLKPYIIDKIVSEDGEIEYQGQRTEIERVASLKTIDKIKELMRSVITGNSSTSTGYYYYMDGYDLIAKTGTAQVANPNGRGYSNSITVRSLAGMFPGDDPQVLIYFAIQHEDCAISNISTLVKDVIKNTSKYLEIYDETKANITKIESSTMESYIDKNINSATSSLKSKEIDAVVIGNGDKVVAQYPKDGEQINKIEKVFLLTNGSEYIMPDLTGYSYRDLYVFVNLLGLKYTTEGIGYVIEQSIPAGTPITSDMELAVKLEAVF